MQTYKKLVFSLFTRRTAQRLGRSLYMYGRGDIPNNMRQNGELLVQECVLEAWKKTSSSCHEKLVVFDVGANVGDWTKALLKNLPTTIDNIEIYCFEPVSSTYSTLCCNLPEISPMLHIEELALSSKSGTAELYERMESNCGRNSLHYDPSIHDGQRTFIRMTTAADFCNDNNIEHLHLMKCDTEGHDFEVIQGALPMLSAERISVIQFEYNEMWILSRYFLRDVFAAIDGLPYKVGKLQPDYLLVYSCWHHEMDKFFEGNYVLIHDAALLWFPIRYAIFDSSNVVIESLSQ